MATEPVGWTAGGVAGAILASGLLATVVAVSTSDSVAPTVAFPERLLPEGVRVLGVSALLFGALTTWGLSTRHPRSALWLGLAQASVLLPLLASGSALPSTVAALTLATFPLAAVCLARCCLAWGSPVTDPFLAAATALGVAAVAVHAVAYDPFRDPACVRTCQAVAVPLAGMVSTHTVLVIQLGCGLASAALAGTAVARQTGRLRPVLVVGAAVSLLGLVAAEVARVVMWSEAEVVGHLALAGALVPVPLAVSTLAASVSGRRTRRALDTCFYLCIIKAQGSEAKLLRFKSKFHNL